MKGEAIANLQTAVAAVAEALGQLGLTVAPKENPNQLLGYDGLRQALAIDGKEMSERNVKRIAAKHKRILRPVPMGPKLVGFRRVNVQRLIDHLESTGELGRL